MSSVNNRLPSRMSAARLGDLLPDTEGSAFLDLARGLLTTKVNDIAPTDLRLIPGKLDHLETRLETLNLLQGSPRTARGTKTAATANLQTGLDEAEKILKKRVWINWSINSATPTSTKNTKAREKASTPP